MTYNNLPLFEACIDARDTETGMFVISLVDSPANERDFVAFEEVKQIQTYSVANDEEQKVFGLIMEADKPIYRRNEQGFEYYITYNRKTIEAMSEKYFKMGLQNNVDTQHNFELEDGITLTQMFIKNAQKGVNPTGFEDVNDGSLFAEFHIENTDVWNAIKEGTYKGFSLAGVFIQKEVEQIEETYNKKENKILDKMNKVKEMLRKLLATFGEISTSKGVLTWQGDEELKEGVLVKTIDAEGNEVNAEDGDYRTEDKKIITIKDGKVISIVDDEAEVAPEGEVTEEPKEGVEAEEEITEEPKEDDKDLKIKELEDIIKAKDEEIEILKARIAELEAEPTDKSAEEAFAEIKKVENPMAKRGYRW